MIWMLFCFRGKHEFWCRFTYQLILSRLVVKGNLSEDNIQEYVSSSNFNDVCYICELGGTKKKSFYILIVIFFPLINSIKKNISF